VKDIKPGTEGSYPYDLTNADGRVFFSADGGTHGTELWKSDGIATGTSLVKDINPEGSSRPYGLANVNRTLFFAADDGTHGWELWKIRPRIRKTKPPDTLIHSGPQIASPRV
jgi:ELWxxDGT repeat protein